MKCLYIGDFLKEHSTENYVSFALEENGVEVVKLQESYVNDMSVIEVVLAKHEVDFVLFCKNRVGVDGFRLMGYLKGRGIKTVTWVYDLYFDLPPDRSFRTTFDSNFKADIVFSTDGGHDDKFIEHGYNHKLLRQGVHVPDAHLGNKTPGLPEIAFIGSVVYADRRRLVNFLKETYGINFKHYGMGGGNTEVRGKELNDLLASIKIVVGDSQPSDNYWSNRVYEITGRGGFLLHPKVKGLEKEFEYYKEIVPYAWGNLDQLKEIIDFYLTHDDEREKIRMAGFERTKRQYTYSLRVKELLKNI